MDVAGMSPGSRQGPCAVCGKLATMRCSQCAAVFYCSKGHQSSNWVVHRSVCKSYKCIQEPNKESYLVATRKIPKGRVIMQSKAIVVGPSGLEPVCLGCLRPIFYDVMSYQCGDCGWPVCNMECQQAKMHKLECEAMKQSDFRLQNEQLRRKWHETFHIEPGLWILALRVLLSNKKSKLFSYYRKDDEKLTYFGKAILPLTAKACHAFITQFLKQTQFHLDEIASLLTLFMKSLLPAEVLNDHHSIFEQRKATGVHASDVVYLQHSCLPNMAPIQSCDQPGVIKVISLKDIEVGEILTTFKMSGAPTQPTLLRQSPFLMTMSRVCACLRCKSPSELNLYCGSLACKSCRGMVVPLSVSALMTSDWACENKKCGLKVQRSNVLTISKSLQIELDGIAKQQGDLLQNLVKFIDKHSGPSGALHQQHHLIISAKDKFCCEINTQSSEKGASYKFSDQKLTKFFKYSLDVEDYMRQVSFHVHFSNAYCRRLLVASRSVIHKMVCMEIKKKEAEEKLQLILHQLILHSESIPIRDIKTEALFEGSFYELMMHFRRINVSSEKDT